MITDQEIDKLNGYVDENLTLELKSDVYDDNDADIVNREMSTLALDEISINEMYPVSFEKPPNASYCRAIDFSFPFEKFESFINWSIATYKTTREIVQEKLGKANRTVDVELEQGIDALREVQRRYEHILMFINEKTSCLRKVINVQYDLSNCFLELAESDKELCDVLKQTADNQLIKANNNKHYFAVLDCFSKNLKILCETTFEDTITTYRNYDTARLDYDVHRHDLETLQGSGQLEGNLDRLHETEQKVVHCRQKYETLRDDVQTKMRLLHDHKVKVLHKNLLLFAQATSAYFSGNDVELEALINKFYVQTST